MYTNFSIVSLMLKYHKNKTFSYIFCTHVYDYIDNKCNPIPHIEIVEQYIFALLVEQPHQAL